MQLVNFDLWGMLVSIFFLLTTCNSSPATVMNSPNLIEPKNEQEFRADYSNIAEKLTLIQLDDAIYAYEGAAVTKGKLVEKENIRTVIAAAKRKYDPNRFVVIIKSTAKSSYKNTVDLLDEMVINKIERYNMEELSVEERHLLKTDNQK